MNELTPQQERFCQEYVVDLNGTQAATRAGYSAKSAVVQGSRLLTNANVQARIKELIDARAVKTGVTAERVVTELAKIAFATMRDVAVWNESGVTFKASNELEPEHAASISEVSESTNQHGGSLRIKQHDKVRALELLGKHLRLFADRVDLKFEVPDDKALADRIAKEALEALK